MGDLSIFRRKSSILTIAVPIILALVGMTSARGGDDSASVARYTTDDGPHIFWQNDSTAIFFYLCNDTVEKRIFTVEDIAEYLGTSVKSIEQVIRKIQSTKIVPLDALSGDDGNDNESSTDRALVDESIDDEEELRAHRVLIEKILDHVPTEHRNLVCLRYGVIDSISNTTLCKKQALREIFRQAACKAILQQQMAQSAEDSYRVARSNVLPAD